MSVVPVVQDGNGTAGTSSVSGYSQKNVISVCIDFFRNLCYNTVRNVRRRMPYFFIPQLRDFLLQQKEYK